MRVINTNVINRNISIVMINPIVLSTSMTGKQALAARETRAQVSFQRLCVPDNNFVECPGFNFIMEWTSRASSGGLVAPDAVGVSA